MEDELMGYITKKLTEYNIRYEIYDKSALRAYGNFSGYAVIRTNRKGWVEVDKRIMSYDTFEKWLKRARL